MKKYKDKVEEAFFMDPRTPLKEGEHLFTAFVTYPDSTEEIDVREVNESKALKLVKRVLKRCYEPGYTNIKIEKRIPGIIYF